MSSSRKLDFRWLGPYQIYSANKEKGYYKLKELGPDGALLRGTFSGNRLKLFYKREKFFYSPEDEVSEPHSESDHTLDPPETDIEDLEQPSVQVRQDNGFVIRVPTLTDEQRSQYTVFQ